MAKGGSDGDDEIDIDLLAGSMRRVYLLATGVEPSNVEADQGWSAAAAHANAMFAGAGDGEFTLKWSDFAAILYRAGQRAYGNGDATFADLPEPDRSAWEAVARHAANLMSGGDEAVRNLAQHENHWRNHASPVPA